MDKSLKQLSEELMAAGVTQAAAAAAVQVVQSTFSRWLNGEIHTTDYVTFARLVHFHAEHCTAPTQAAA